LNLSSVVVFQIDVGGIAFDPAECNPPVSAGADRIAALIAASERVKANPGKFMSSGRDASSSDRRMLAIRLGFCTLSRRPSPVPKNRSRALSRNDRIMVSL
jgi:hypothetical protein